MTFPLKNAYTVQDIYALPDGQRAELIDGHIYDMAPPSRMHQRLSGLLHTKIQNYIQEKNSNCEVYAAPFAVFLNQDDCNYVEPDISVICDPSKLDENGCNGAPDWIIEITSPSNPAYDYGIKQLKYRSAGVREYWIVNPMKRAVIVYDFVQEKMTNLYSFEDTIPVCIFQGLEINILEMLS